MDNIYSYLNWRGDLPFSASAFNEVDSLILASLSYVKFDEIVPGIESEDSITLTEVNERYWELHENIENTKEAPFFQKVPLLMREVSKTVRYRDIRIGKYINHIDAQKQKQFSAVTFLLQDYSIYIAYRGTDTTIVGWKEDFNMSFTPEVPAQSEAVKYLEKVFNWTIGGIRIGGHSKGGNLAIYAGVKCRSHIRKKILSVHNFDGPGFTKEFLSTDEYKEMFTRIISYLPKASIIGMLLEHSCDRKIVNSNERIGIYQHDPLTWEVNSTGFSCLNELDKSSLIMDGIVKEWVNKLDYEQRKCFVDALFSIPENAGVERTSELSTVSSEKIKAFFKSISSMSKENRAVLTRTFVKFLRESSKAIKKEIVNQNYTPLPKPRKKQQA